MVRPFILFREHVAPNRIIDIMDQVCNFKFHADIRFNDLPTSKQQSIHITPLPAPAKYVSSFLVLIVHVSPPVLLESKLKITISVAFSFNVFSTDKD